MKYLFILMICVGTQNVLANSCWIQQVSLAQTQQVLSTEKIISKCGINNLQDSNICFEYCTYVQGQGLSMCNNLCSFGLSPMPDSQDDEAETPHFEDNDGDTPHFLE